MKQNETQEERTLDLRARRVGSSIGIGCPSSLLHQIA